MKRYFEPLIIFVTGNIGLLILMLFFPSLGSASDKLATDSAPIASTFWGWTWVVVSVRLLVFLFAEGLILWGVGKAFLAQKQGRE